MHVQFTVHGTLHDVAGRGRLVRDLDRSGDATVDDTPAVALRRVLQAEPLAAGDRIGIGPSVEGAS